MKPPEKPYEKPSSKTSGKILGPKSLVALVCEVHDNAAAAEKLAVDLDIPFLGAPGERPKDESSKSEFEKLLDKFADEFRYLLVVTKDCLELRSTKKGGPAGVYVDFSGGAVDYRRRYGSLGGQMILKAIGGPDQRVFDATAGLCGDAFVLASHSCEVTALEAHPIVSALVKDGLRRGVDDPKIKHICARIHFRHGDAIKHLSDTRSFDYDVVYLDPMFPAKKKAALPKKELQVLHDLVGDPGDETQSRKLLKLARKACARVVVKRHLRAPALADDVSIVFKGTSTRFDVYVNTEPEKS